MYELNQGSSRLSWALYSVRDDKRVIERLAHILKRWDVQLVQDIEALHNYIEIKDKQESGMNELAKNIQEERRKELALMAERDCSYILTFNRKNNIIQ